MNKSQLRNALAALSESLEKIHLSIGEIYASLEETNEECDGLVGEICEPSISVDRSDNSQYIPNPTKFITLEGLNANTLNELKPHERKRKPKFIATEIR